MADSRCLIALEVHVVVEDSLFHIQLLNTMFLTFVDSLKCGTAIRFYAPRTYSYSVGMIWSIANVYKIRFYACDKL